MLRLVSLQSRYPVGSGTMSARTLSRGSPLQLAISACTTRGSQYVPGRSLPAELPPTSDQLGRAL